MKKLILIASVFITCLTTSETAKANLYFGGGYQLSNLSFESSQARGSYTTSETTQVIDDDLTVIVENGDGTITTTTTTEPIEITTNHVGGYLDSKDYFANSFENFNIFTGISLNDTTCLEVGFMYQQEGKSNNNSNEFIYDGKTSQSSATLAITSLDMVFSSLLIDEVANLNIIVGASAVSFKTELDLYDSGVYTESISDNHMDFGLNLGVGIETKLNNRLWLRTSIKGIILPESDFIQSIMIANVGLKIVL